MNPKRLRCLHLLPICLPLFLLVGCSQCEGVFYGDEDVTTFSQLKELGGWELDKAVPRMEYDGPYQRYEGQLVGYCVEHHSPSIIEETSFLQLKLNPGPAGLPKNCKRILKLWFDSEGDLLNQQPPQLGMAFTVGLTPEGKLVDCIPTGRRAGLEQNSP